MPSQIGGGVAQSLTTAARKKPAPIVPQTQRVTDHAGTTGESGWTNPTPDQPMPQAKLGGPHRKMHAPGMRGRK